MGSAATPSRSEWRAQVLFPSVVAWARAGKYTQAEEALRLLLRDGPEPRLHCLLGKVLAQRGDHDAACRAFQDALRLDPGHVEAAAALARATRLSRPVPAYALRRWRLAACVLATVGFALGLLSGIGRGPMWWDDAGASGPALEREAPARRGVEEGMATADPGVDTPILQAHAHVLEALGPYRSVAKLTITPRHERGRLVVRLEGTVPTAYVKASVSALRSTDPRLLIEGTELTVTHRYTVRRGDTLGSIARALYGTAEAWHTIWEANRETMRSPDAIVPGAELRVPDRP
jgi:tetratricopeptide (TPR) repeat protein